MAIKLRHVSLKTCDDKVKSELAEFLQNSVKVNQENKDYLGLEGLAGWQVMIVARIDTRTSEPKITAVFLRNLEPPHKLFLSDPQPLFREWLEETMSLLSENTETVESMNVIEFF